MCLLSASSTDGLLQATATPSLEELAENRQTAGEVLLYFI